MAVVPSVKYETHQASILVVLVGRQKILLFLGRDLTS